MSYQLLPVLWQRFGDGNNAPLSGGKLYSYIAGTSTPRGTYQDNAGTPNTNPVILDGDGYANVWVVPGGGAYKFILTDADDVVLKTIDNVTFTSEAETPSGWSAHDVTDGQLATNLSGETLDLTTYSAAIYDVEIARNGRAAVFTGQIHIQKTAASARVVTGLLLSDDDAHGVTFDCTVASNTAQLRAALSSGLGNGTLKLSRKLVPL